MKSKRLILSLAATLAAFCTVAYAQQQIGSNSTNLTAEKIPASDSLVSQSTNSAVSNTSGAAEMALAEHLKQRGAKMYGAFWCPYCTRQKELFGREAFSKITYIECDARGQNAQPDLCRRANVRGFPTWEISGQQYGGMQSLTQLADISGYKGSRNFRTQGRN
jgi:glutaredoxin